MTDDLDDLLSPRPAPHDPAAKEALFRRTAGVLTRRRLIRRAMAVAAAGLVFALGVGVGRFATPTPPALEPVTVTVFVPVPVPVPGDSSASAPLALSAPQLELEAEKATDRTVSADLFRRAADKYLAEMSDIPSATRCYASHLAEAGPGGRAVSTDDSWLLIRMKTSRKENGDDPNAGA